MAENPQRRTATFDRVLGLRKKWKGELSDEKVVGCLENLEATRDAVVALRLRMSALRGKSKRAAEVRNWRRVLREDHLLVLKGAAEAHLTDASGKPIRLRVPHFKSNLKSLFDCTKEFDEKLRPHVQTLIAQRFSPHFLEQMHDAANQLQRWMTAPDPRREHAKARHEMTALVSKGRKLIDLLRRLLAMRLEQNAVFKGEFDKAAKVVAKPGPPKERFKNKRARVPFRKRPKRKRQPPERM